MRSFEVRGSPWGAGEPSGAGTYPRPPRLWHTVQGRLGAALLFDIVNHSCLAPLRPAASA